MAEAGPDERIYYCNDNEIVWARDYMSQNYVEEEPLEIKARFGLDVRPKKFKFHDDR